MFDLGQHSLSKIGVVGVIVEVVLIGYILVTSLVGLYSIPAIGRILPHPRDTPVTHLILNCAVFVVLSSSSHFTLDWGRRVVVQEQGGLHGVPQQRAEDSRDH